MGKGREGIHRGRGREGGGRGKGVSAAVVCVWLFAYFDFDYLTD